MKTRSLGWGVAGLLLLGGCYTGNNGAAGGGDTDSGDDSAAESGGGTENGTEGGTDGGTDDNPDDDGPFACNTEMFAESLALRRLSKLQYRNAIADVIGSVVANDPEEVVTLLEPLIDRLPEDTRTAEEGAVRGGFRRLDQNVHQEHINASYDVALAAAIRLTNDHLEALAGSCATDADAGNDGQCVDDFIRRLGERAYRRPLTDEEVTFFHEVYDADGHTVGTEPEAFRDVLIVMLTAPQFLYFIEHGGEELEDRPGTYRLTGYELAQRLSFQFWQAPPDDELREAARSGALETEEGYAEQVERLLADARAGEAVREFYGEWLWLEDLPALDARIGTPAYDTILAGLELGPDSTDNAIGEVLDMAAYYTLQGGTFADFFLSDRSFASTPDLAEIYGVPVWDGGEPPTFPQPERAGLIARAAFVASGSPNTRPIMKGVRIREALLCEEIPPPPDNAAGTLPEITTESTTREVVEALTEQAGTACAGCHQSLINPLGFVTENFDSVGRYRTEQVLVDEEGNVVATRPVDTSTTPYIAGSEDRMANNAAELSQMLVDGGQVQECFARNYVRWTFGRIEDEEADGCMLNAMTSRVTEGEPLTDVLRSLAMRDEFKTRRIEE